MLILTLHISTRDWRALTHTLRGTTWPAQMVARCGLYRNAYNASKAWLLIECAASTDPAELRAWVEELIADLNGPEDRHKIEHVVWEAIEHFC